MVQFRSTEQTIKWVSFSVQTADTESTRLKLRLCSLSTGRLNSLLGTLHNRTSVGISMAMKRLMYSDHVGRVKRLRDDVVEYDINLEG